MTQPRPTGFLPLALLLAGLAVGAFIALGWVATGILEPIPRAVICAFALLYGTSALLAAIGLWRVRPWTPRALAAWLAAAIAGVWVPWLATGIDRQSLIFAIGGSLLLLALLVPILRYVSRQVQSLAA